ncbi:MULTISPECIES: DUF4260 domain-containing protein [Thalassobacillus]|uniref:DUF4260 domain-containing protein n=1 Tax=Thalassobacillus TaxID=331971 RepID=UPI000A1CB260|nr:DUF4260 domain-containing protein [Thalassobacillus devorans]
MNRALLQLEGFIIFLSSVYFYGSNEFSWVLFIFVLFTPDISMLGYLINKTVGAYSYNAFHSYLFPICLCLSGLTFNVDTMLMVGLIWIAHIGMDRGLGFGLKYPSGFKDTHIQKI